MRCTHWVQAKLEVYPERVEGACPEPVEGLRNRPAGMQALPPRPDLRLPQSEDSRKLSRGPALPRALRLPALAAHALDGNAQSPSIPRDWRPRVTRSPGMFQPSAGS